MSRMIGDSFEDVEGVIHEKIFAKGPYPLPMTDELKNSRKLVEMARKRQQDQNDDEAIATMDQIQQQLERERMINARLNRFDIVRQELGFAPDDVEEYVNGLINGVDVLDEEELEEVEEPDGYVCGHGYPVIREKLHQD